MQAGRTSLRRRLPRSHACTRFGAASAPSSSKLLDLTDRPYVVQDTDLFATVGYWEHWNPGTTPESLVEDARAGMSDLYLVTLSNIPFEPDPLRYGVHERETPDAYWIALAERYGLNYRVMDEATPKARIRAA